MQLKDSQIVDESRGWYFNPHKLSEKRPTLEMFLSAIDFDERLLIHEGGKYLVGDNRHAVRISEIDADVYAKLKDRRIESVSITYDDHGKRYQDAHYWVELIPEQKEQIQLF